MTATDAKRLLEVKNLRKYYPIKKGFLRKTVGYVRAADDVSFFINEGETLGLVGESGCGKTTVSRCILRAQAPTEGEMLFRTKEGDTVDLSKLDRKALRPLRSQMQMIFQDPYGSLNPRMTIFDMVGEPLQIAGMKSRRARSALRSCCASSACAPSSCSASPTRSAAASGSASASPARSRSTRASSSRTNRSPHSTSRCRPRRSTCCSTCKSGST